MGNIQQIRRHGVLSSFFFLIMFVLVASVTNGHAKVFQNKDKTSYITAFTPDHPSQHDAQIRVTLDFHDVKLSKALLKVAKKANVGLSFDREIIPQKKISYHCHEKALYDALYDLLIDTNLTFTISADRETIIIQKRYRDVQFQTVTGTVTDAQTGTPMVGVNILVVGTSIGTVTDIDGHYRLSVASLQDTLRFSYIGYQTKTVPIIGRTTIDVALQPQVISGQQLVVIGYGKQKKRI